RRGAPLFPYTTLPISAKLFDWECDFLDDVGGMDIGMLARSGVPILAIENAGGAEDLFKYRPPAPPFAVVVGNERYGLSHKVLRLDRKSTRLNSSHDQI